GARGEVTWGRYGGGPAANRRLPAKRSASTVAGPGWRRRVGDAATRLSAVESPDGGGPIIHPASRGRTRSGILSENCDSDHILAGNRLLATLLLVSTNRVPGSNPPETEVCLPDGVRLHVAEHGDPASPLIVVFLHGWTLDARLWRHQIAGLPVKLAP